MGTTLFAAFRLFDPLQHVVGSLGRLFRRTPEVVEPRARAVVRAPARLAPAIPAPRAARCTRPTRRLRVVRVFEGPQAVAGAGRMVISGRMADVCAELERMAAQEATAG